MIRGIAITVRYAGPTDTRGSRWIATADHPTSRAVVGYSHELDAGIENAKTAAEALIARWNAETAKRNAGEPERFRDPSVWTIIAGGHLPKGDYAFIAGHAE